MPDLALALPTRPDIGQHQKVNSRPRNRKWKPEVEITFEWKQMAKRFQRLPHIFDHARLRFGTDDMARHRPTSESQMSVTKPEVETGSGNNF